MSQARDGLGTAGEAAMPRKCVLQFNETLRQGAQLLDVGAGIPEGSTSVLRDVLCALATSVSLPSSGRL